MSDVAIQVDGISKRYRIGGPNTRYVVFRDQLVSMAKAPKRVFERKTEKQRNEFWALKDVSFQVRHGEVLGIIGRNGAGKSTLLKVLSRITEPTAGRVEIHGRVGSLLEVGTGFHPELSGRENIYLNGAILGMTRRDIKHRFDEIVGFAEIDMFLDTPVKHYSSGMYTRLAFSVAAHLEPEILIVDEVLAVGDAAFQRKCLGKMGDVARDGRTVLFVSHNMTAVQHLCETCTLLDHGRVVAQGETKRIIEEYHDHTEPVRQTSLAAREDRSGDGRLRFTDIDLLRTYADTTTSTSTLICGSDVTIDLAYEGDGPLTNVQVSMALYDIFGQVVLYLANDMIGTSFDDVPSTGRIQCRFDKLPLLPGRYSINLRGKVNGSVADWIKNAAVIDVVPGDFFGTGKLPYKGYGSVVVPHEWRVA
jgi:lipopolysaccharide transport system ATP-binding protein